MDNLKRPLVVLILVAGLLGFLEATSALLYQFSRSEKERDVVELLLGLRGAAGNLTVRYAPHPYFNFVSYPGFLFKSGFKPHNRLGLRGPLCCTEPKPADLVRLVAVGGSTTYGAYFGNEKNVWPALLEKQLLQKFGKGRIEVVNAGTPNYTTYELLGLLAMRVSEFSPNVVLIHTGVTDAFTVGFPDEGGPDNTFFRRAYQPHEPIPNWLKPWMKRSYFVRLIGMRLALADGFLIGDVAEHIQYAPPSDDQVKKYAKQYSGKYFRRNLKMLAALCQSMEAMPVFVNEPLNPAKESGQTVYASEVAKVVIRHNEIMKEVAQEKGILYVDVFSQMRDPKLFLDAVHMNQSGMALKTRLIADQINQLLSDLMQTTVAGTM